MQRGRGGVRIHSFGRLESGQRSVMSGRLEKDGTQQNRGKKEKYNIRSFNRDLSNIHIRKNYVTINIKTPNSPTTPPPKPAGSPSLTRPCSLHSSWHKYTPHTSPPPPPPASKADESPSPPPPDTAPPHSPADNTHTPRTNRARSPQLYLHNPPSHTQRSSYPSTPTA